MIYEPFCNSPANTSMYPVSVWVHSSLYHHEQQILVDTASFPVFPNPDGLLKCCISHVFPSSSPWSCRELQELGNRLWECQLWKGERAGIVSCYPFPLLFILNDCFHTVTVVCGEWDNWASWLLTSFFTMNIYICAKIYEYAHRYVCECS